MSEYKRQGTPEERRRTRFLNKSSATAVKYLRKIDELPHKPQTLDPFLDVLRHIFVDMNDAVKPENTVDHPLCALPFQPPIFTPSLSAKA